MTVLGAIWAQSLDGIIGDGRGMPWHVPEDLAHFRRVTQGHPVIMGRLTWLSLPEEFRPLPGRENIIVCSREPGEWSEGGRVVHELPVIFDSPDVPEAWVTGGGQIYAATIGDVDVIEVTLMGVRLADVLEERAVYAPEIPSDFGLVSDSNWLTSAEGRLTVGDEPNELPLRYRFLRYERKAAA